MAKKKTQSEFIQEATKKHGGQYLYNLVEYKNSVEKVEIICPEHGSFWQSPAEHSRGKGCGRCAKCAAHTTETFIEQANKKHGNKYDYNLVRYANAKDKVIIGCPVHGPFEQSPTLHLFGQGCRECSYKENGVGKRLSEDKFFLKCKEVHGSTYDYSNTVYTKASSKVSVVCPKHGTFSLLASSHMRGDGCSCCSRERFSEDSRNTLTDFVTSAERVHGVKYDYSESVYKGVKSRMDILCREHGVFSQRASDHLSGNGCPQCAKYGYRTTLPGYLYVLKCEEITKIGITNRPVTVRVRRINQSSGKVFEPILFIKFEDGNIPLCVETEMLRLLRANYPQPTEKFDGSTECFYAVNLEALTRSIVSSIDKLMKEPL